MIEDVDIYRAAKVLVDHHGDAAGTRANARADELLKAGDEAGHAVWMRIAAAVGVLASTKSEGPPN